MKKKTFSRNRFLIQFQMLCANFRKIGWKKNWRRPPSPYSRCGKKWIIHFAYNNVYFASVMRKVTSEPHHVESIERRQNVFPLCIARKLQCYNVSCYTPFFDEIEVYKSTHRITWHVLISTIVAGPKLPLKTAWVT